METQRARCCPRESGRANLQKSREQEMDRVRREHRSSKRSCVGPPDMLIVTKRSPVTMKVPAARWSSRRVLSSTEPFVRFMEDRQEAL